MPGANCIMQDNINIISDHVKTIPASNHTSTSTSPFQRFNNFTSSIRRSFNRIRTSKRQKSSKSKRKIWEKDGAISDDSDETTPRDKKSIDLDCESVDSGLETDQSSDLTPGGSKSTEYKHTNNTKSCLCKETGAYNRKEGYVGNNVYTSSQSYQHQGLQSNRSSSYYPDSLLSTTSNSSANIDRKSSGRSNHTIDSGILVNTSHKRSPVSRNNLRYSGEEILPKKRVSILLPEKPVFQARIVRSPGVNDFSALCSPSHGGTLKDRAQVEPVVDTDVIAEAMHELMSINSQYCDIIFLMFIPRPNLKALTEDDISRILFGLYSILKSGDMRHLHFFEISVWMLQRFVFKVSRLLETRPGLSHMPPAWESLIRRSEIMKYSRNSSILEDTRSLYLELWLSLLGA